KKSSDLRWSSSLPLYSPSKSWTLIVLRSATKLPPTSLPSSTTNEPDLILTSPWCCPDTFLPVHTTDEASVFTANDVPAPASSVISTLSVVSARFPSGLLTQDVNKNAPAANDKNAFSMMCY